MRTVMLRTLGHRSTLSQAQLRSRTSGRGIWLCRFVSLAVGIGCASVLNGQAFPTASRAGELQVGANFSVAIPDYNGLDSDSNRFRGFGLYSSFDFKAHFGAEIDFRQVNDPDSTKKTYERTYEIGPRYVRHFGALSPYAKALVGRGVFNFPAAASDPSGGSVANLAYNMAAFGAGADYSLRKSINLRADFEWQRWIGFPQNDIEPKVFDVGLAYRFH